MRSRLVGIAMQILVMAIVISVVLLFFGIAVLVFIHICIRGRALMQSFGDDNARRRERGDINGGRGLSAEDLKKLPCYDYVTMQEEDTESNTAECAVCLETFRAGDKCRMLPECRHSFHADCVDSWLLRSAFCPTCRTSADRGIGKDAEELEVGISTIADTADD